MRKLALSVVIASGAALAGCGAPPKVLMSHQYATQDKSVEVLIQQSGAVVKEGKTQTNLFNVFMRVCSQSANNEQSACKDTLVLENVYPGSL